MINKILIAVDRSQNSKSVFSTAVSWAKITGAKLMLLHVLSVKEEDHPLAPAYTYYPIVENRNYETYQKEYAKYEQHGIEFLRNLTREATAAGVQTEFTQLGGNPGRMICELASSWSADLILIGSRGLTGLKEMFLGSVSNYVTHHAPCSVLIIRADINSNSQSNQTFSDEEAADIQLRRGVLMINKILVAVDYSQANQLVFDSAASLAKTVGADLMLLNVLAEDEPSYPVISNYDYYPVLDSYDYELSKKKFADYKQQIINFWSAKVKEATAAGINTEFTQLTGNPGRAICELASTWSADLILIGSRGLTGLKEMFLGSVSNYVTHHAPCSVLIVRTPLDSKFAQAMAKSTKADPKQKLQTFKQ